MGRLHVIAIAGGLFLWHATIIAVDLLVEGWLALTSVPLREAS